MRTDSMQTIFDSIDAIIKEVDSSSIQPNLNEEIKKRKNRNPIQIRDDNEVLKRFARMIAFSQNAKSGLVEKMLERNVFNKRFILEKVEIGCMGV